VARPKTDISAEKHRILQAAEAVMSKRGANCVTMSAVARQAGMSQSNIYRFFDDRDHLLLCAANRWFNGILALTEMQDAMPISAAEKLKESLLGGMRIYRQRFEEDRGLFDGYMSLASHFPDVIIAQVSALRNRFGLWVQDCLQENGVDIALTEDATNLFLDMTILFRNPHLLRDYRKFMTEKRATSVANVFLDMLTSEYRLRAALGLEQAQPAPSHLPLAQYALFHDQ
tara:strand:+ start:1666 stop:2352 length:687 start_codon:yes stop_codon:yes gene_type:complete